MRSTNEPTRSDSPRSETRRRSGSPPPEGVGRRMADHSAAIGLLVALTLALLSEMPWLSRPIRAHILQATVVAYSVFLAATGPYRERLGRSALRGPAPWLLALLAWCVLSVVLPPARAFGVADLLRPYAVAELLRMLFCGGVFFAAAYGLRADDLRPVVYGALGLGTAVAIYGLALYGSEGNLSNDMTSLFNSHEPAGSYIMLFLPVALALALDRNNGQKVMLGAQAVTIILAAALLAARTRSAWIGACLGLIVLAGLSLRVASVRLARANKSLFVGPLLILGLGFTMLLFSDQLAPLLSQRAATLSHVTHDDSFQDRLRYWRAACRMTFERPVFGWGLGTFPIIQQRWSGEGEDPEQAITQGTSYWENAHNFWVQWAAETGVGGLFLYVATVMAFLLSAGRILPGMRPGFHRTLLLGCLAATVGACGDMAGAPSYVFPGVSALPWLWMGLGLAACRESRRTSGADRDVPALPPTPAWVWIGAAAAGLIVSLVVLGIGGRQPVRPVATDTRLPKKYMLTIQQNWGIVHQLAFPVSESLRAGGAEQ